MAAQAHPVQLAARGASFIKFLLRPRTRADDLFPTDTPAGVVAGPDPDRVLMLGEATGMGYGVLTHDLGLAGQFARRLSQHTGRGVEWSTYPIPGGRLRGAPRAIAEIAARLEGTDIFILVAGIVDTLSLTTRTAWGRDLAETLDGVGACLPSDALILIAEIPPLGEAYEITPLSRLASGRQSRALNRCTRVMVAGRPRCVAAPFPEGVRQAVWSTRTLPPSYAGMYAAWSAALVDVAGRRAATPPPAPAGR